MSVLTTVPQLLRAISAADTVPPATPTENGVINTVKHDRVRFYIDYTASGSPTFTVQPMWWDGSAWYADTSQSKTYNATGKYLLDIAVLGGIGCLQCTAIESGGAAVVRYALAKNRMI